MKLEFDAHLESAGPKGAWCFLAAPFDVEKCLGTRARVPVRGTINGFPFRSSLTPMGGRHLMAINKAMQSGAKVKAGDTTHFVLERDTAPRTVKVPSAVKKALTTNAEARKIFDRLSFTHKKEYVNWISGARKPETLARRLGQLIPMLLAKQRLKS